MRRLVEADSGLVFTSIVTYAEMLAVLGRCLKERRISAGAYRSAKRGFLADWRTLHVVDWTSESLRPPRS